VTMWNWFRKAFAGVSGRIRRVLESSSTSYNYRRREYEELLIAVDQNPWLSAVVRRTCEEAANLTWMAYAPERRKRARRAWKLGKSNQRQKAIEALLDAKEIVEIDHEVLALLESPNPTMDKMQFMYVTLAILLVTGEVFWVVERSESGKIAELWPVPPHWVLQTPSVREPFYRLHQVENIAEQVPESDVFHIKTPSLHQPYGRGVGVGQALSHEIDIDEEASRHMLSFFHNGARPDLLIGVQDASQEEVERAKATWHNSTRGADRAHATHFYSGDLNIHHLTSSFNDLEMVELRKTQRNNVIQAIGFPPEMLGIVENSNRTTIEASEYFFEKHQVVPLIRKIWYVLQFKVVPDFVNHGARDVILDHENPVPEDKEFHVKVLKVAPETRTINEYRQLQNLPPIEGGDELYSPSANIGTNDPGNSERDDSEREDDAEAAQDKTWRIGIQ